jgi:plasmid maintenance system antidote protein VapI
MSKKSLPLSEQFRKAIETCGESRYAISKATGIDQSALSRFIHGERGLSMDVMDRLGEYLGLKLVATRRPNDKER